MQDEGNDRVTFMEEVNYKMEYKDNAKPPELILLKNEQFS